ncbi:hypothetical protein QQM39_40305 [Streptomyces sp. DT2A-34]|uniref:hypothetical protein n=1 Tax=Streptomyces sp. DT2A-34 TaxID=3051182 RepID=UPI00265BEF20|nr:hypothetical protein [Streptomyces sp. DT2A-34]MDO0916833.1 hypothetical protein [Streptomyces sp. DT2A-34]
MSEPTATLSAWPERSPPQPPFDGSSRTPATSALCPTCDGRIIGKHGKLIGQVAHIEAAEKGGERYNPDQTDEQRRHYDNLMLLCSPCHVLSDDVVAYPVERLRQIKADHEAPFASAATRLQHTLVDIAKNQQVHGTLTLTILAEDLGWAGITEDRGEQISALREQLDSPIAVLRDLPLADRSVLGVLLRRGEPCSRMQHLGDPAYGMPVRELQRAIGLTGVEMVDHLDTLERHGLVVWDRDDSERRAWVETTTRQGEEDVFVMDCLKTFCDGRGLDVDVMIRDLRFDWLG